MLVTKDVAISLRRITRACSERIARVAFELAMSRRKRVTIVHKANVLKVTDGLFIEIVPQGGEGLPGHRGGRRHCRCDDGACRAQSRSASTSSSPPTCIGDILSDLTAELSGSLGLAASLNAGTDHGMAQAAHGSAPDIAGQERRESVVADLVGCDATCLAWPPQKGQCVPGCAAAIEKAVEAAIGAKEFDRRHRRSAWDARNWRRRRCTATRVNIHAMRQPRSYRWTARALSAGR